MQQEALGELARVVRDSGLIAAGSRGVVLVSGGPDSACAAAGAAAHAGAASVHALHLDYGLRADSGLDRRTCEELCGALGIELDTERPRLGEGNMQAAAREARYAAAERLADRLCADWIATGHTRTDLAETVVYRLATSPGSRALLGLPERRGRLVRPLLAIGRDDARRLATEAGLPFRDDPSNADPGFARNRVRAEIMPVLRELSPAAERNIAATRAEIAEDAEALGHFADEALDAAGASGAVAAVSAEALSGLEPAVRRLALRRLAERVAGRVVPLGRERAAEIWRLARASEGGEVELGGGLRALCEHGMVRFVAGEEPVPEPVTMTVPGRCRFGPWELRADLRSPPVDPAGPELATLDAASLGPELLVRGWREGDRMRPLGLGGSKSLADLFADSRVPRSLRRRLPLVTAGGRIAWVAGVAVSDDFKLAPGAREVAVLSATIAE